MEAQMHPLALAIPRFIQMHLPLPPLSVGAFVPPESESPHAVIDPSALRAAKANAFEWRFAEMDYSRARNDFGGFFNAPSIPGSNAFAVLKADGSIMAWGNSYQGGSYAPAGSDYTKIRQRHHQLNKSWYSQCQRVRLSLHSLGNPTP
jgi:hypothetical protein